MKTTKIFALAAKKFLQIDGTQWAGAFAYNAFFSLFPSLILLVTIASFFIDHEQAGLAVINFLKSHVPIAEDTQSQVFTSIVRVISARGSASIFAFVLLLWTATQCFITLTDVTNRAWDAEPYSWWRLPLRSMLLLGILSGVVLVDVLVLPLAQIVKYHLGYAVIPWLMEFFSLCLFYKLAPRRFTRFSEVWLAALCVTLFMQASEGMFVYYLQHFATLNLVYGAFGGIMALLLWIYLAGCVFIFGACLCAVQHQK